MRRPRIGIPLSLDDRERWRRGRAYHYIDRLYADAIDQAGGVAVQLPIQSAVSALVDGLDGLLIPGGDDFPSEVPLPAEVELDLVPEEQRQFDAAVLAEALRRSIPVLGICYGMQLLVLEAGGRLYSHLPSQRPECLEHRPADPTHRHPIEIEADSALAAALGTTRCEVNSLHHQAVREPGDGLRTVAQSPDGVIEAVESTTGPERMGVQWHPEKMLDAQNARLFGHFVVRCRTDGPG